MKRTKFLILLLIFYNSAILNCLAVCNGRIINPITSVCWSCLFPLSIGPAPIVPGNTPDIKNYPSPICLCPKGIPPIPLPGIAIGLWEPVRLVDVAKDPFCFVNLGGKKIKLPFKGKGTQSMKGENTLTTWHIHYYVMPILNLLSIIINIACAEIDGFDILYMTELDPLWTDDELSFIINPESAIFGNPIAQASCSADCVAATAHLPLDTLFWCGGCQGSMYPLTGNIVGGYGAVQSSLLATERILYKMGRQGMALLTSTSAAICQPLPMPIIKKSQYRTQMTFPVTMNIVKGCKPLGRSNVLYDSFKEIPMKGESFGYLIWRKRNCCAL